VVPFEQRLLDEMDAAEHARRAAERAARLYAVAVALAAAATPEEVAAAVLQEGVAALGASGGGVLLATENDRLFVPATVGYDAPVVARLREEAWDAELPAASALRTGEPVWLETIEERDRRFPALAGFEPETIAMCAIPVASADEVLGALRFSFTERRLFDEDEQRFVLALAAETSQALQRAQVSALLQQSLLPAALPEVPGIELGAAYSAAGASVGGDFYDAFSVARNRWGITMGDVRGRGPRAAALTGLARYTIRTAARLGRGPAEVLEVLNAAMAAEGDDEQFCTAVFATVEVSSHGTRLTVANGGHPPVAVIRQGRLSFLAPTGGLLGVVEAATFGVATVGLGPGDALVLYTDGISEARNGAEEFGDARLADFLRQFREAPAQELADGIIEAAQAFRTEAANDDAAAFVLRVRSAAD
jgi:serine phosphatase RsbU (regulator of sigma subunit)